MRRRAYLGTVASGVGLLGGCLTGGDPAGNRTATPTSASAATATPTATPTEQAVAGNDTATRTETEEPTATEPQRRLAIDRANLVWATHGSDPVVTKQIQSAGTGGTVPLGVAVETNFREGDGMELTIDVAVETDEGTQVDAFRHTFDRQDDPGDRVPWYTLPLDTRGFSTGRYVAEVVVTDERRGLTAEPERFEFDLVEPLESDGVELRTHEPETVTAGEEFSWALTLRNLTDRTSTIQGTLMVEYVGDSGRSTFGDTSWTLPARSTVTMVTEGLSLSQAETYRFRLSPYGLIWEIEVEPAGATATPES